MKNSKYIFLILLIHISFTACRHKTVDGDSTHSYFNDYIITNYKDSLNVNWNKFNIENSEELGKIHGINSKKDSLEFIFINTDTSLIYYVTPNEIIYFKKYRVDKNEMIKWEGNKPTFPKDMPQ